VQRSDHAAVPDQLEHVARICGGRSRGCGAAVEVVVDALEIGEDQVLLAGEWR
jgi:hypothetical protein